MAVTMLLRNMLEPSNPQAYRIWDEVQGLLQVVAAQQAKSLASRCRGVLMVLNIRFDHQHFIQKHGKST
jgi:hypothetical protein